MVLLIIGVGVVEALRAQELMCDVRIDYSRVSQADPSVFRELERAMEDFLNGRSWTQIRFEAHERIRCQIFLQIQDVSGEQIVASALVQAERPVYNSTYTSPLFTYRDENFQFSYSPGEQIIYSEGTYTSELSALLSFYAYLILGVDFSTFGPLGGVPFLQKALEIATLAGSISGGAGWSPDDKKRRNRYWLITWILQPGHMETFLQALYEYHRLGLDLLAEDLARGRQNILNALTSFQKIYREDSRNMAIRVILEAKRQELIGLFQGAPPQEKQRAFSLLTSMDPSHRSDYTRIFQ